MLNTLNMAKLSLKMFFVSVFVYASVSCAFAEIHSNRRILNQLAYVTGDIAILFENVANINKTVWSEIIENKPYRKDKESKRLVDFARHEVLVNEIPRLIEAFEAEKRLNRILSDQIQELLSRQQLLENRCLNLSREFESEKLLNRELKVRVESLENTNSDKVKTTTSFLEYRTVNTRIPKDASDQNTKSFWEIIDMELGRDITTTQTDNPPLSCASVAVSGVYDMYFRSLESTRLVYCDADTDGGKWIVTMRRKDGSENFDRNWNFYKKGFGKVDGEFWIGNDILNELTEPKSMQLRIDMEDFDGNKAYARYDTFYIGPEHDEYTLFVSEYSGTAGDSLNHPGTNHNIIKFTTLDSDNDLNRGYNCAARYPGGWWFNMCFRSHLTGVYSNRSEVNTWNGVIWYTMTGSSKSLKFVEMKLRYN